MALEEFLPCQMAKLLVPQHSMLQRIKALLTYVSAFILWTML